MTIVINGTTGISGVDGSAGTPAVQGTDTNTGEFFPAADTVAWATGGNERMRVDSSGNVGIGTSSPNYKLQVKATTNQNFGISGAVSLTNAVALSAVNDANSANVPIEMRYATNFAWFDAGTERMRIDSSGNLQFNSGYGSVATAYGCRAWVNFNGTGTVAIRASGNVSSITDIGVGDYTVNFTNAMPDANYAFAGSAAANYANNLTLYIGQDSNDTRSTTQLNFKTIYK